VDWIDVTVTIRSGMVHWPGDEDVVIERTQDLDRGDPYNMSRVSMGLHAGTHMDAPLHFDREGPSIDEMPLSATVGPARVIEILDPAAIKPSELAAHAIRAGERILFKTSNSGHVWESDAFVEDYVYLSAEAARYLAEKGVLAVGVDYLSVGPYGEDASEIHLVLLEAGIWIIEGLDLSGVEPGDYELVCLPLKVARGDGAPARAILRPLR
jgi:arylformamidase